MVGFCTPFQSTVLVETKPLPVTVRVKPALPIFAEDGEMAEICGTGFCEGVGVDVTVAVGVGVGVFVVGSAVTVAVGVGIGVFVGVAVGVGVEVPEVSGTFRSDLDRVAPTPLISPSP